MRLPLGMTTTLKVRIGERWYTVEVGDLRSKPVRVQVDGEVVEVDVQKAPGPAPPARTLQAPPDASPQAPPGASNAGGAEASATPPAEATRAFTAPMPGVILSVAVQVGDLVVTGDEICVLEAMKMQQTLRADWSGVVRAVRAQPGQQVLDGDPIVELEDSAGPG